MTPFIEDLTTGSFDIASGADQQRVRDLADALVASPELLDRPTGTSPADPVDLALALKLAVSKTRLAELSWAGRVAVVFAMWGERRRLLPRSPDNPTGERALAVKLDQLDWLLPGTGIDWLLVAVDDGDPGDSASVALAQAQKHRCGSRVTVLRLSDALPARNGPLIDLKSVDGSRKGGAIVLGAQYAVTGGADAVVITDADNSVNLGQLGLLIAPFGRGEAGVVVGDRKHPDSILVKAEDRWGPGIVVLRHMQRMVGRALFDRGLRDTQAAFKLYGRRSLEAILANPSTFGFAFDSDWLYAAIGAGERLKAVPFAFLDSFEESASITQGPMSTWESLLTGLVAAARARGADHDPEMAQVVDDFARVEVLERIVERVPEQLKGVAERDLGRHPVMSPAELRVWIEGLPD